MSRPTRSDETSRALRRIAVVVVATVLAMVGVVLVFTPGPAIVVLTLALAVLATEFAWARRWLRRLREEGSQVAQELGLRRESARGDTEGGDEIGDETGAGEMRCEREHVREGDERAAEPDAATRRGDPS